MGSTANGISWTVVQQGVDVNYLLAAMMEGIREHCGGLCGGKWKKRGI